MTILNHLFYPHKNDYVSRNNQKQDESNKTYAQIIDDVKLDGSVLLDIAASELAATWQEAMRIQGVSDPSKVDGALLGKIKDERAFETDPVKIGQNIQDQIAILQDGKTMAVRYHCDENAQMQQLSNYTYEQMKSRASDILREVLQDLKFNKGANMQINSGYNNVYYPQSNSYVNKNTETKSILDNALSKAGKELSTEEYADLVGFVWKSQSIINFRKNGDVHIKDYNDKLANSSVFEQKRLLMK